MPTYTVYIVRCSDDTLYTGYTSDIQRRLAEHNNGTQGARYTRTRRPVKLVFTQTFTTKSAAMKREAEIKALRRSEKNTLIKNTNL